MRTTEFRSEQTEKILPLQVNRMVVALCGDYDRRKKEIEKNEIDKDTLQYYRYLNDVIDASLTEECEPAIINNIREDIGNGVGHRRTQLYYMAAGTYKKRKRNCKYRIAKKLRLL